ncbi:hypothetical protein GJ744_011493 [Endocarpon pusillum]|uniref:Delta(24(24(1)))-sterol reductase n=1 Tax=Endocarpon pusillum TaxID=364733 RepID=A0A8H7E134_9EURO|nr:hypothetical protein GJ744_011493 [Endocarpon pusillum]
MTVTRTQAGKTPRKTQHPGYVETPGRKSRSRVSGTVAVHRNLSKTPDPLIDDTIEVVIEDSSRGKQTTQTPNGHMPDRHIPNGQLPNGHLQGSKEVNAPRIIDGWKEGTGARVDSSGHFEFGGSWGVSAMMIGFPMLMYYMWIGATYYDGRFPTTLPGESFTTFLSRMGQIIYTGAFPSLKAWAIYWTFFLFEAACYLHLPGIYTKGKPLRHANNQQLTYYCSAVWSFYTTLFVAALLHLTNIFKLYTIIDEFGPLMSVAIISGFLVSILAYASAILRGATHRMTGYPIYDFFMGAELNPRIFGLLDFKMFFEVRLPWYILLLVTLGTAARQYENYGYVSGEVAFLCMAHFLYANACSKGEECIVPTWDMYYEKWGFMLIFWNLAGVPLSYCHCTIYLANHDPSIYRWNRLALAGLFVLYLFVYWIWDTANSQKNRFKAQLTGHDIERRNFPQLPWRMIKNPKTIPSANGDVIFVDGWYAYARKIHYTCDLFFALSWGAVTGFNSPFPWFYPVFFACMITHRAVRDIQRCRAKYGDAWREYERRVPWLFVPYVF